MWQLITGGILGGIDAFGSYYAQKEEEKRQKELLNLKKLSAQMQYSALESSTVLQKDLLKENTTNAIAESDRNMSSIVRDKRLEYNKLDSREVNKSSGLVSGISAGRNMIALQIQEQKDLLRAKQEGNKSIIKMLDYKNNTESELNARQLNGYNNLVSVLSENYQGTSEFTKVFSAFGAGLQGFTSGYGLGSALSKQFGSSGSSNKGGK